MRLLQTDYSWLRPVPTWSLPFITIVSHHPKVLACCQGIRVFVWDVSTSLLFLHCSVSPGYMYVTHKHTQMIVPWISGHYGNSAPMIPSRTSHPMEEDGSSDSNAHCSGVTRRQWDMVILPVVHSLLWDLQAMTSWAHRILWAQMCSRLGKYLRWGPCCCWPDLHWADLLRQPSNSRKQVLGPTACFSIYPRQAKVQLGEPMSLMGVTDSKYGWREWGHMITTPYPPTNMSDNLWTLDSRSTHSLQGSNRLESDLVSLLITSHTSHTTHTLYQTTPRSPWKKAKKYAFIISIMMPSVCVCVCWESEVTSIIPTLNLLRF